MISNKPLGAFEDESAPDPDPLELRIREFDVRGAVFVVPVDAPIPSELGESPMPVGTLYKRLAALDTPNGETFAFVPVSGSELLALDRVWRTLQTAPRVFVLVDLPGARYDVLFGQAARQIGLPKIEWPSVSEAMASRVRVVQRTADIAPWTLKGPDSVRRSRLPGRDDTVSSDPGQKEIPPPEDDE